MHLHRPSYNTGNEAWVYNDAVNSPMMKDWLGKEVDREDLTRHDKWCCMMMPRLRLLRDLMTDDGAIFISIDDNEVHHLRCLMDEVFGAENFIANVIWEKVFAPKNTARHFSQDHDHIICYARNAEIWEPRLLDRSQEAIDRYKNGDEDPRGPWSSSDLTARNSYKDGTYEVTSPSGKKFKPSVGNYWRVSRNNFKKLDEDGRIWWGDEGSAMPRLKRFLSEVKDGVVPQTLWKNRDVGHTQEAKKELVASVKFERSEDVFNTVKPTRLIRRILQIASDADSIVLDSFAGSGTTGQAVLAQNAEDGGNRRFVLIECEDYIEQITSQRIRNVIKGVPTAKDEKLKAGYGGEFSYYKLGQALELKSILDGADLPEYKTLAGYVYFTATGEEFDAKAVRKREWFIGESRQFDVYLIYEADAAKLRDLALTLDMARNLKSFSGRQKLVFAPTKYLDPSFLDQLRITFCQLPYQIYQAAERHLTGGKGK